MKSTKTSSSKAAGAKISAQKSAPAKGSGKKTAPAPVKATVAVTTSAAKGLSTMSEQQMTFCKAFAQMNCAPDKAVEAAKVAGYGSPNKRVSELLKNLNVIGYLATLSPNAPCLEAKAKTVAVAPSRDKYSVLLTGFINNEALSISERIQAIVALHQISARTK